MQARICCYNNFRSRCGPKDLIRETTMKFQRVQRKANNIIVLIIIKTLGKMLVRRQMGLLRAIYIAVIIL